MALLDNAILTITDLKAYLDIPDTDDDYDDRLESVINALTEYFAVYTGRDTMMSKLVTEYTEGKDDDTIFLRNPPISETTSSVVICLDTDRLYPAANNITRTYFVVYERTGKVVLIDDYFPSNPLCVKATYYGGWVTLPADLRHAALEAAQYMWKRETDGRVGVTSVSAQAGGSVSFEESALPKAVTDVLDRYRRWSP